MKKLVLILITLLVSFTLQAQDRSIADKAFSTTATYLTYTGVTADTLTSNQDSVDVIITLNKEYPVQAYVMSTLTPRAGADTAVTVYLYGRIFPAQAWTLIGSTATTVSAAAQNIITTIAQPSSTFLFDTTKYNATGAGAGNYYTAAIAGASIANYYRQFRLVYVIAGNDAVGTGVKITNINVKLWRREY